MKTQLVAICTALGLALSVGLFADTASAAMVYGANEVANLADLEDGGSIEIHGQRFSGFSYTPQDDAPTADEIFVEGVQNDDGSVTLVFDIGFGAGFLDPQDINASLRFSADIVKDGYVYDVAELAGVLEVPTAGDNTGAARLGETIVGRNIDGDAVFQDGLLIENLVLNGEQGPSNVFDSTPILPELAVVSLEILKDIRLEAGDGPFDRAGLTTFTQTYGKVQIIPEPNAAALLMLGAIACVARRR